MLKYIISYTIITLISSNNVIHMVKPSHFPPKMANCTALNKKHINLTITPSCVGPPGTCKSSQTDLKQFAQDVYQSNLFLLIKLEFYLQISNIYTPYSTAHKFIYWKSLDLSPGLVSVILQCFHYLMHIGDTSDLFID